MSKTLLRSLPDGRVFDGVNPARYPAGTPTGLASGGTMLRLLNRQRVLLEGSAAYDSPDA